MTPRSARRRAREFALRALYEWQLSRNDVRDIRASVEEDPEFPRADGDYFRTLVDGVVSDIDALQATLAPALDRKPEALSPIERAILFIGVFELRNAPDVPYRVVINEAVELAKSYGGTDGYKYVNGVLDRIAAGLRPAERTR